MFSPGGESLRVDTRNPIRRSGRVFTSMTVRRLVATVVAVVVSCTFARYEADCHAIAGVLSFAQGKVRSDLVLAAPEHAAKPQSAVGLVRPKPPTAAFTGVQIQPARVVVRFQAVAGVTRSQCVPPRLAGMVELRI